MSFFKTLCNQAGVTLSHGPRAFHPQTNGLTERTNEVVTAALRHYVTADMRDWDEMLPLVEFALNSCYHQAIRSTPFRMNRITLPANPFDVLLDNKLESSTELAGLDGHDTYVTQSDAHLCTGSRRVPASAQVCACSKVQNEGASRRQRYL